ncbi:MAG: hypothetical protein CVV44_04095 [Spirochaetae bacterium HGW-Spirochaetae-1]|jgi:hypothetical protein|nr:MAG: hypothetical protein CVV44_04095 [Spirochaetae bacterium HGW-Spirochaetae-1]
MPTITRHPELEAAPDRLSLTPPGDGFEGFAASYPCECGRGVVLIREGKPRRLQKCFECSMRIIEI